MAELRLPEPKTPIMSALVDSEARVYASSSGRVDILRCRGRRRGQGPSWQATRSHFVFPLAGAFVWHVGRSELLCDTNQLLFAPAGSESAFSHPHGPELSMVLTPSQDLVGSLTNGTAERSGADIRSAVPAIQIAARGLRQAIYRGDDPISLDERLIDLTGMMFNQQSGGEHGEGNARRTLERSKAYLQTRFTQPLSLGDIATAVGVTPVYLTSLFRRVEGMALHQYLLSLRLTAALDRLPGTIDITTLALDLGFSSHSHFTSAFRKRFGTTPATFRQEGAVPPSVAHVPAKVLSTQPLCPARGGVE